MPTPPSHPPLLPLLKQYFGYTSFRPLQEEIIRDALAGQDVLALLPTGAEAVAECTPVYETLPGWSESTAGARSFRDLNANAVKYVRRIEELIGAPVALLSTSPERDDTIMMHDPFRG